MACGVPVVSTDGGALPEVVGDAGVIVPAKNVDALVEAANAAGGGAVVRVRFTSVERPAPAALTPLFD